MAQLLLFELTEGLEPSRMAQALLLKWNGREYSTIGARQIIVHSFSGGHGVPGDRGYCFLGESGAYETVGGLVSQKSFGL